MTRVLLVDDKAMVRAGLKGLLLESKPDMEVLEASSGDEALQAIQDADPDVVFLDISMPGKSGLHVLGEIREMRPFLPVVMLTVHGQSQFILLALERGAKGYLTKDSDPSVLAEAIERVLAGGTILCPQASRLLGDAAVESGVKGLAILSGREREVFLLLAGGKTVQAIAGDLRIDRHTVSTHKARIYEKMGWERQHDMYRFLAANGLLGS